MWLELGATLAADHTGGGEQNTGDDERRDGDANRGMRRPHKLSLMLRRRTIQSVHLITESLLQLCAARQVGCDWRGWLRNGGAPGSSYEHRACDCASSVLADPTDAPTNAVP